MCFSRFVGELLHIIFPGSSIDPGVYAVCGAAAFASGVTHMTMSLTVRMYTVHKRIDNDVHIHVHAPLRSLRMSHSLHLIYLLRCNELIYPYFLIILFDVILFVFIFNIRLLLVFVSL